MALQFDAILIYNVCAHDQHELTTECKLLTEEKRMEKVILKN